MELGEKLKAARLESGLSQRQLCDGLITRNMLSQIENGTASPSMKTLAVLAQRLGKSVSYFLEEAAVVSPNGAVMESARRHYDREDYAQAALVLEAFREPDPVYGREKALLWYLTHLALAKQALAEGRDTYAKALLQKADVPLSYCAGELNRQRLLLLGRVKGERVSRQLPGLDEELLLRAQEALEAQDPSRAAALLEAAEDQTAARWLLLRGRAWMGEKRYFEAARCLHGAEPEHPEAARWLEECYRELGDYRKAYHYAKKQQ